MSTNNQQSIDDIKLCISKAKRMLERHDRYDSVIKETAPDVISGLKSILEKLQNDLINHPDFVQ